MAGSRLEKYGTIFTRFEIIIWYLLYELQWIVLQLVRMTGLLRSGAIADCGKPIWYDIYKTFPPNIEPNMFRSLPNTNIIDVIYPEDIIRAYVILILKFQY
jgi:hypothetical protein